MEDVSERIAGSSAGELTSPGCVEAETTSGGWKVTRTSERKRFRWRSTRASHQRGLHRADQENEQVIEQVWTAIWKSGFDFCRARVSDTMRATP